MTATVSWETIGVNAPVEVPYTITASVDRMPSDGKIYWSSAKGTVPDYSYVDPKTLLATATVTVPRADKGSVILGAWADSQPPKNITVAFNEWDSPSDPNKKSTITEVGTNNDLAPVINYDGYTLYNDDATIEFRIGLFDYKGDKIVGGEVRWSFEPLGTGISVRKSTLSGNEYPVNRATPGKEWYQTITGSDGYARIRVGTTRTWGVTMSAQVLGATGREWAINTATAYFASANDTSPELMAQSVTVDLDNGILSLYSDTWVAHMPDPLNKPWGTDEFSTFFYVRGQGDHLLFTDITPAELNSNYLEPVGYLYNKSEIENLKPNNTPILYSQNSRTAEIFMSSPQRWGTKGEIKNAPPPDNPPQTNRKQNFPWANVGDGIWSLGLNTWITTTDVQSWGGLPMAVKSDLPGVADDQYWLFFVAYLNGADPMNSAAIIWPPVNTAPADMIVVASGSAPYTATIPEGKLNGYRPLETGQGSPLYLDFYITPKNKQNPTEENKSLWLYASGWPSYRLNT